MLCGAAAAQKENGRDLDAYQKKAIFGGATIRGERLLLVGAQAPPRAGPASAIELDASTTVSGPRAAALDTVALRATARFSADAFRRLVDAGAPAPAGGR